MFFSIAVYLVVVAIIIYGVKFCGVKSNLFFNPLSRDASNGIRGLIALFIILHHVSQNDYFRGGGDIQFFCNAGPFLVSIFMFYSGYGLYRSYKRNSAYLDGFMKEKVLKKLVLPFYINTLLYGIFYLLIRVDYSPSKWICSFLGLNLMNGYAWFPIVLIIFYITFYIVASKKASDVSINVVFCIEIFVMVMIFAIRGHYAWWYKGNIFALKGLQWMVQERVFWFFGEWWINSLIGFLIGLIFAEREEKLLCWLQKKYWLKLIVCIVFMILFHVLSCFIQQRIGYYAEYSRMTSGIIQRVITWLFQVPEIGSFILFINMCLMKFNLGNPILKFFNKYSFDTYMMNLIPISLFGELLFNNIKLRFVFGAFVKPMYLICVLVFTVLLALVERVLIDTVKKHIA